MIYCFLASYLNLFVWSRACPDSEGLVLSTFALLSVNYVEGEEKLKCDLCGKSPQFGHNVSHSKRRTNKRSMPNIHPATVVIGGVTKKLTLCTRCIRTQNKEARKLAAAVS
ncbi:MAG: 50S ribosomal protein L28 [Chloroflexi bacterium]|nr:50S ribosomal protein L28 [Chloroflexota bacterium]